MRAIFNTLLLIVGGMIGFRFVHQHWAEIQPSLLNIKAAVEAELAKSGNNVIRPANAADPTWNIQVKKDEMSDQQYLEAASTQDAAGGGEFDLKAACGDGGITFEFDYFAQPNSDAHYFINGRGNISTESRLDAADSRTTVNQSKYNNATTILFSDPRSEVGKAAGGLLGLALSMNSAGKVSELVNGSTLRVRLPLTDGRQPVVAIDLQDSSLQKYFSRCGFPGRNSSRGNTQTSPASGGGQVGTVNAIKLNLRSGPGTDYDVVATMDQGLRVKIIHQADNGWIELEVPGQDRAGFHGFAGAQYISTE